MHTLRRRHQSVRKAHARVGFTNVVGILRAPREVLTLGSRHVRGKERVAQQPRERRFARQQVDAAGRREKPVERIAIHEVAENGRQPRLRLRVVGKKAPQNLDDDLAAMRLVPLRP